MLAVSYGQFLGNWPMQCQRFSLGERDRDAHVVDLCEGSMETGELQFREEVQCLSKNVYIG